MPPGHERIGFSAAQAVAGHRDQERLPVQGQGVQRLVRDDRRRARDATQQRDLPEAVAGGERRPGLSPHADRRGPGDDQVEQLAFPAWAGTAKKAIPATRAPAPDISLKPEKRHLPFMASKPPSLVERA